MAIGVILGEWAGGGSSEVNNRRLVRNRQTLFARIVFFY